jgi:hypothetical protein
VKGPYNGFHFFQSGEPWTQDRYCPASSGSEKRA